MEPEIQYPKAATALASEQVATGRASSPQPWGQLSTANVAGLQQVGGNAAVARLMVQRCGPDNPGCGCEEEEELHLQREPEGGQEAGLREKETRAEEHIIGLATVGHFHYEKAITTENQLDNEHTTKLAIDRVVTRPGPRNSFTELNQAIAHASMAGLGSGAAVIKYDGLFYAVRLKTEGFRRERMYRFQPNPAAVAEIEVATGEDGTVFQKFTDYDPDPERIKKQRDAANAGDLPSAADLRSASGMSWGAKPGQYDPGQLAPIGDRRAFIKQYFKARALEILAQNEQQAEGLAETFKPGKDGVSPEAKALIDSSRRLLPAYKALLEAEAHLDRDRALVERAQTLGQADLTLRGESKKWFEWRDILNDQSAKVQTAKSSILDDAPMLAHLVPADRLPKPGVPSSLAAGLLGTTGQAVLQLAPGLASKVDNAYDVVMGKEGLRGENQTTGNVLGQAATPQNDEAIRSQFKERLDAIKGAIKRSRAEIQGDGIDPLSMSGLRQRVQVDMRNIKGTSNDLWPVAEQLLAETAQRDLAWDLGMMVVQVGLLFVPGGQFLSAVVGAASAVHDVGEAEKRWDVSQASVNPTKALVDQQEAAYGRIMATINLILSFVALGGETVAALHELEAAALAKSAKSLSEMGGAAERSAVSSEHALVNALGEHHEISILNDGRIIRCSYACQQIAESLQRRAANVGQAHSAEAASLVEKGRRVEAKSQALYAELPPLTKAQRAAREKPLLQEAADLEQEMSKLEVRSGMTPERVPDGGLALQEARGAHVLERHVGKMDLDLWSRYTLSDIRPAPDGKIRISSWKTLEDAESAVARGLGHRDVQIRAWLAGGASQPLYLQVQVGVVGETMVKGASEATTVDGVWIMLVHDPARQTQYKIVTAYPIGVPTPYPPL